MMKKNSKLEVKRLDRQTGRQAGASAGTLEGPWPEEFYGEESGFSSETLPKIEDAEPEPVDEDESAIVVGSKGSSKSSDDALGLYLKQMGAIPLLNRKQELDLAQRLETARLRYRHAALSSRYVLGRVLETFTRIKAGKQALDPMIDVVTSLGLSRERILARIPSHLRTLRHVLEEAANDFRMLLRAGGPRARARQRRQLYRRMGKAIPLASFRRAPSCSNSGPSNCKPGRLN